MSAYYEYGLIVWGSSKPVARNAIERSKTKKLRVVSPLVFNSCVLGLVGLSAVRYDYDA